MECRGSELRDKEIINITDGSRIGYVGDVIMDLEEGRVSALVVPGRLRLFGYHFGGGHAGQTEGAAGAGLISGVLPLFYRLFRAIILF